MREVSTFSSTPRKQSSKLLAAEVAGQQWGVIGHDQLRDCGVSDTTMWRWRADGRLHVRYRGVYALGHTAIPIEGRLVAALLYAGRGSVLSHATAAWWWGLIAEQPERIELSLDRRISSPAPDLVLHQRAQLASTHHRRFPITSVAQTLLDYAGQAELIEIRRALAEADYRRLLDPAAIEAVLGQGRKGTTRLRRAFGQHQPKLARTRSWLETIFIPLCEDHEIPIPEVNVRVNGWLVDALWREQRVVVELDGYDNHSTRAQMERDRRKELELRAAGFLVIRYTRFQVVHQPELVAADLIARIAERPLSSSAERSA